MSDYKPNIYANFINRRNGDIISAIPVVNNITINKDLRQLTDSFDFDFSYGLADLIDINSHDFVEFYFLLDDQLPPKPFQICCGFVEDFVKETSSNVHRFQANGRDFLGHLLSIPFSDARPVDQTPLVSFADYCVRKSYLQKYLDYKHITRSVLNEGAYSANLTIRQLSDAKMGPVLQQTADEVYNIIYQNRHGQAVVWGRSSKSTLNIAHTLNELGDSNVKRFVLRENFSKVISEVQIFYTGGLENVNLKDAASRRLSNSEDKALEIYQPEIRTFQMPSLVTTQGVELNNKMDLLAASIIRRSNQNLTQVVITTNLPFYIATDGTKVGYEVNQVWNIKSKSFTLNEQMRLVGINYHQTNSSFDVELMFILEDSLV
jgi:hypothetical protein